MEILIPLVFIPFFILLWVGVAGLMSLMGGWRTLAKANPMPPTLTETGEVYSFQSLRLGYFVNYNSSVKVTVYMRGMMIVPILIFRFFHKPIFIEYGSMRDIAYGRFIFQYMTFTLGEKKIMLMGRCVLKIKERIGRNGM